MTLKLADVTVENLLEISSKDLQDFQVKLSAAIDQRSIQDRINVHNEMQALASKHGFSLAEFLGKSPKKYKAASTKYRNPANHKEVWAGRGRKPNWLLGALADGKSLEDFKI